MNFVRWGTPDGINWCCSEYFSIVCDSGERSKPTHLLHVSGEKALWPACLKDVKVERWTIEDNFSFCKATFVAVGGVASMACTLIFVQAGIFLQPPILLPTVACINTPARSSSDGTSGAPSAPETDSTDAQV